MKIKIEVELHGTMQEATDNTMALLEHLKEITTSKPISKRKTLPWGKVLGWSLWGEGVEK